MSGEVKDNKLTPMTRINVISSRLMMRMNKYEINSKQHELNTKT